MKPIGISVAGRRSSWAAGGCRRAVASLSTAFGFTPQPILLDLDGNGIRIAEIGRSTMFVDAGGDGLQHRTAWAGAGDGVLFYDPDDSGAITEKRQYVFTEWDPTATDDLAALRSVFDSNGDGLSTSAGLREPKASALVRNTQIESKRNIGVENNDSYIVRFAS